MSELPKRQILGVDTGGTFTDFVLLDQDNRIRIHKVLSTPRAPEQAILQGIDELGLNHLVATGHVFIVHGSTVATNAALEGKGAKTVFITNSGFKDLLSIGRQARRELYNLQPAPIQPPVPESLCYELPGRINSQGQQTELLNDNAIAKLKQFLDQTSPEAVAINFLFSFLNPSTEQQVVDALGHQRFVSASHQVLPESGEYERAMATWLNASLGPKVMLYLYRLQAATSPSSLAIMQSTGGTMDAERAGRSAVNMLLSGPAGGLAAAKFIGDLTGQHQLLTFDMGGTSTDVALIDHDIQLTNEGSIGPWPVAVSQVDMHTIGAGGGSIAFRDKGGLLQVGPESAGADPGPACYGKGGTQPTVTDANAVLGRLRPDYFLGGKLTLDLAAAKRAVGSLAESLELSIEETAFGIIQIANEHMARALRVISIERGYCLEQFRLCCFGGAGGLHLCALAQALGMHHALVPIHGGVLSALGMVVAPKARHLSHSERGLLCELDSSRLLEKLTALAEQGKQALLSEGVGAGSLSHHFSVDLRYQGQRYYLNLPWSASLNDLTNAFHNLHQQRFGHQLKIPVEVVNLRCHVAAKSAVDTLPKYHQQTPAHARQQVHISGLEQPIPIYWREDLSVTDQVNGPALIAETVSTTFVDHGWTAQTDQWGNLLLDRGID